MSTDPLAFVGLAVALLAGLSWIIKAQISMSKQFTPNGGSSFRGCYAGQGFSYPGSTRERSCALSLRNRT